MCSSCSLRGGIWPRFLLELHYLGRCWRSILIGAVVQLLHSTATNLIYWMHEPTIRILKDNGFKMLSRYIPQDMSWTTEIMFFSLFIAFFVYAFSPILLAGTRSTPPPFSTVLIFRKMLIVGGFAQLLRVLSFMGTVLPSPAPHCHAGSPEYNPPVGAYEILFRVDGIKGCGDLIYSSHVLLSMTFALCFSKYSPNRLLKTFAWLDTIVLSVAVIAFKKHYTVDVVVAWYVTPMLFYVCDRVFHDSQIISEAESRRVEAGGSPIAGCNGCPGALQEVKTIKDKGEDHHHHHHFVNHHRSSSGEDLHFFANSPAPKLVRKNSWSEK